MYIFGNIIKSTLKNLLDNPISIHLTIYENPNYGYYENILTNYDKTIVKKYSTDYQTL